MDNVTLFWVVTLLLLIGIPSFALGSVLTDLFSTAPEIVFHRGILEFANETTLVFTDGEIYTSRLKPVVIFLNSSSQENLNKTHYDWKWTATETLVKGTHYKLRAFEIRVFWVLPLGTDISKIVKELS